MHRSKLFLSIIALMLVAVLAACQAPAEQPVDSQKPADTTPVETEAPPEVVVPEGAKEVVVWSNWTGAGGDFLAKVAEEYNASQSEYFVNLTYAGSYAEVTAKVKSTAVGSRPAMFFASTEGAYMFYDNPDYYVPIQKYIDEDGYDMSSMMGNLVSTYTNDAGEWQSMPLGNTVVGFFYNTAVLEAAGVDPLTELNSWDEVLEACRKIKDVEGVESAFSLANNSIYYTFPLTAEGVAYVDNDNGKSGVPTKTLFMEEPCHSLTVKYFDFVKTMQNEGLLASFDLATADLRTMLVNGELGILTSTCSGLTAIGDLCNWEVEFGFHPAPTITAGATNYGQCTGGGTAFICNNETPDIERGAWEFMKYLMTPENTAGFAMATGYLPTTEAGYNTEEYQAFVEAKFPTAVYSIEAQRNTPSTCYNAWLPMFDDFHQIFNDHVGMMINDPSLDAAELVAKLAEAEDECIELYNLSK